MKTLEAYLQQYADEHTRPMTKLTHMVGIPMIVASLPMALKKPKLAASLFVGGWFLQFLGHRIEGNRPAFLEDPLYLMVGPVWVAKEYLDLASGRNPFAAKQNRAAVSATV